MNRVLIATTAVGLISFLWDNKIIEFVAMLRTPFLTTFFSLFRTDVIIGVVLFISLMLWKKKQNIILLWVSCGISSVVIYILKIIVARPRPLGEHLMAISTAGSFPSGHAGFVFATLPFLDSPIWLAFSLATAFSRVYLGVHYMSDVIFGGIVGYLIGVCIKKRLK